MLGISAGKGLPKRMDFTRKEPNSEKVRRYAKVVDIYIVMGTLALVACITLIVSIVADKRLRQHPGQIISYITFCDLILTLKFFIGAVIWKSAHDPGYSLVSSSFAFIYDKCASEALISQFVFGASMAWNLVSVVDFTVELYDPLRNTRSLVKYYHTFAWLWAGATVAYIGIAEVFGPSADGTCYVTKQSVEWALFQVPVMIVMFSGVLSVVYALLRLPHGTAASKRVRLRLLRRQSCYVAIFIGCWILPVIHRFNARTGINDTLLALDAIGISAQGLCLPLYRLLQQEVRFSVDWLPCCWPCRMCERGKAWLYKGRGNLTRRFTMLDSRWGLQSPLLQPRPPDDSDSVIAIPSGPTESGSLNGFVGMPVDTNVDNAFAAEKEVCQSWDSRRISMHNMSVTSEHMMVEADTVAPWGVGKELRRDFGMLLLDGIVKFVSTVKVTDEEASGVSGPAFPATPAMSFQDFSGARDSPFFSQTDNPSGPIQRHDSLKNIGKLIETPPTQSPAPFGGEDAASLLSGEASSVTSLPAPVVGSFPRKLTRDASFSKFSAISRTPSASGHATNHRESQTLRGAKVNGQRIRVSGDSTIVGLEVAKFAAIRSLFHIRGSDIRNSLHPDKLATGEIEAKFSEGRSSSFFCKSADNLFIVKTLEYDEVVCLLEFLPDYCNHLRRNPGTLISLIYGLFCLEAPTCSDVYAIVMSNVFRPPHGFCMDEVYDLKGSTYHRQAEDDVSEKPVGVLMDVDFERRRRELGLRLGPVIGSTFLSQLRKDVELLMSNGFMDYSLLVGIRKLSQEELSSMGDSGSTRRESSQVLRNPSQISVASVVSAEMTPRTEDAGTDEVEAASRQFTLHASTQGSDHLLPASSDDAASAFVNRTGFLATGPAGDALGTEIYMIGIIDILQKYTIRKKIEHKLKSIRQVTWNSDKISAVDVPAYAARFLEFVSSIVR